MTLTLPLVLAGLTVLAVSIQAFPKPATQVLNTTNFPDGDGPMGQLAP